MARFRFTNPQLEGQQGHTAVIDSRMKAFDKIILAATGGGVSERATAKAMETRAELMELSPGDSVWIKERPHFHLQVERLPDTEES